MIKDLIHLAMKKVRQTNDGKVFSYMKTRFMSSELKLLEKVQNKKAQKNLFTFLNVFFL